MSKMSRAEVGDSGNMNEKEKIEEIISFCKTKLGCPYIWGGNGPNFYDCSGLVLSALKRVDWFPVSADVTAQDLYRYLENDNWIEKLDRGSIVFFGKSKKHITHVGIALSQEEMINAAGGDSTTNTVERAFKRGARVEISPIRKDLIISLYPKKEWKR
jgi:cell wall-associated NlpC family hydrolase